MNETVQTTSVLENRKEDLSSISVFISGVLLSIGGMISLIFASVRQTRCTKMEGCGSKCIRPTEPEMEIEMNEIKHIDSLEL